MNQYDAGDRITLSVAFDVSGVPTDPAKVTLRYKDPSGAVTVKTYAAAEITKDGTGRYSYNLSIPLAVASEGVWHYRFEGLASDDTPLGAEENKLQIEKSAFYS